MVPARADSRSLALPEMATLSTSRVMEPTVAALIVFRAAVSYALSVMVTSPAKLMLPARASSRSAVVPEMPTLGTSSVMVPVVAALMAFRASVSYPLSVTVTFLLEVT